MGFFSSLVPQRQQPNAAPVEQRSAHPSQDMDWSAWLGAADRLAGLPTPTVQSSLTQPAVWACVRVLSETVASLPLHVYRTQRGGGRERATNHRLYNLLHRMPNQELTSFEFEELLTSHCATWGNGYAYMDLNNSGQVIELWPLRPDRMSIYRTASGDLTYLYTLPSGETIALARWQVHHRRGLSSDGIVGYSPLRQAMLAIALGMATEEFGARFFSQGAQPGFLLNYPGVLKDDAWATADQAVELRHGWAQQRAQGQDPRRGHEGREDRDPAGGSPVPADACVPGAGSGAHVPHASAQDRTARERHL